ncbi:F-box only protein 21-like isoform X2 [Hylaeus anthracinus]|uniref:F-box only protein 21-like isoform X2 n=1 Tax=Hylaeus volcanicus TaxID=313075 RepID=UPI0023B78211|nr:F-box only protein 21-like isoform X2 [Hylaeus volcanicus]XP_054008590.1 F-box only protein 21-like isoform X2 [Hylaeus anthracinus]
MAKVTINLLPADIIICILEDRLLGFLDVVNFSSTCKSLYRNVNNNNQIWRTKFFQRWPLLKEVYQTNNEVDSSTINWRDEAKASLNSRMKLLYHLSLMSSKHYKKHLLLPNSVFKEFDHLFLVEEGAHPLAYHFLVDELFSLIKAPAISSNLTHRYYALKVIRYLKHCQLRNEWKKFTSLPPKEQTLERGAVIVAQWSQPEKHISYSYISSVLDNIADQTKEVLREQYPNHSIFSTSADQFNVWKNNIIDDNQWNVTESRQITDALCQVLFQKLGFSGNSEMFYLSENSFIDCVLEQRRGIPVTLAIVFESVARRLGIHCEPVNFPSHFLLRWKESVSGSEGGENFYIDVFNGGQFLTQKSCPRIGVVSKCPIEKYNIHTAATAVEVVSRMANNLEFASRQHTHDLHRTARLLSALQFQHMIFPNDASIISKLVRTYILWNMDVTELVEILENIRDSKTSEVIAKRQANVILRLLQERQTHLPREREVEPKKRVPGITYAVGLIMRHKVYGYHCVIRGWNARDSMSPSSMNQLEISDLRCITSRDQKVYTVYVDDGSCRFEVEENLSLAPQPGWINNDAIGRYFCKFNGTHYIPNEETAREYPEDEKVRNELLATYMQSDM